MILIPVAKMSQQDLLYALTMSTGSNQNFFTHHFACETNLLPLRHNGRHAFVKEHIVISIFFRGLRFYYSAFAVESFLFVGANGLSKNLLVRRNMISLVADLLHYNARQFMRLLNVRGDINSRVRLTHEHLTPTNNDDSSVTKIFPRARSIISIFILFKYDKCLILIIKQMFYLRIK